MRQTRWAGLVLVAVLGLGGLAACGDDDGADVRESGEDSSSGSGSGSSSDSGSGSSSETTDTTEAPEDEGGGEAATGVEGYCEAVDHYIEAFGELLEDPTSTEAGAAVQEAAAAYSEAALNLGELSAEDQARFNECAEEAAQASADLVPGG